MKEIELSAGTIRYRDTGEGPPLVFVHGFLVDGQLWRKVVPPLERSFRCIVPDLPFGSHTIPMKPDADLTPRGLALLLGELIDKLGSRTRRSSRTTRAARLRRSWSPSARTWLLGWC